MPTHHGYGVMRIIESGCSVLCLLFLFSIPLKVEVASVMFNRASIWDSFKRFSSNNLDQILVPNPSKGWVASVIWFDIKFEFEQLRSNLVLKWPSLLVSIHMLTYNFCIQFSIYNKVRITLFSTKFKSKEYHIICFSQLKIILIILFCRVEFKLNWFRFEWTRVKIKCQFESLSMLLHRSSSQWWFFSFSPTNFLPW